MITLTRPPAKKEKDSTVALINIVFLMLIFFLITGTITPPLDNAIEPVTAQSDKNPELDYMLSVRRDGSLYYGGQPTSPEQFASEHLSAEDAASLPVRLFADRQTNAARLVDVITRLKSLGVKSIHVVTQRQAS